MQLTIRFSATELRAVRLVSQAAKRKVLFGCAEMIQSMLFLRFHFNTKLTMKSMTHSHQSLQDSLQTERRTERDVQTTTLLCKEIKDKLRALQILVTNDTESHLTVTP